jgi:hypothetical protein
MTQFYTVYPERRHVTARQVRDWYADAVANNELDPHRVVSDPTLEDMAAALDDAGIVTFGRAPL